jgi:hypothetical protein
MKNQDVTINAAFENIVKQVDAFCAFEDADSKALQVVLYTALGAYKAGNVENLKKYIMPFLKAEVVRVQNERDNLEQQLNN